MEQLGRRVDLARLERGGLRVITSLDYDLQLQVACADGLPPGSTDRPAGRDGDPRRRRMSSCTLIADPATGETTPGRKSGGECHRGMILHGVKCCPWWAIHPRDWTLLMRPVDPAAPC